MIAAVNPEIIIWARERAGLSTQEVADKVKRPLVEVQMWEDGTTVPSYTMLESLAYRHFKIPLAVFFFPEPPEVDDPVGSFRRLPDDEFDRLSPDTRKKIRLAQAYQDSLAELLPPRREQLIHARYGATPSTLPSLAAEVRGHLGVSIATQFSFLSTDSAFKAWRHALELIGIFTFKDSFEDRFISGFCLLSSICPIIMVNNSNAFSRQIFTLAHELGHILLGVYGVTDADESYIELMSEKDRRAEIACNRFAADLVVPLSAFRNAIGKLSPEDPQVINQLASKFSVSREVVLRRLLDDGRIDEDEYERRAVEWNREYLRQKQKTTGGNWYMTRLSYLGESYTRLALDRHRQGAITTPELAGHLNVKARNIGKLREYLG